MATWTGLGDGMSWKDADNWEPKSVPQAGGDAQITADVAPVRISSDSAITLATLQLSSCVLEAPSLSVTGQMHWDGGAVTAAVFTSSGVLTIAGSAEKGIRDCALTVLGPTVVVGDAGRVYVSDGASWTNIGVLQCLGRLQVSYGGGMSTTFINRGQLDVAGNLEFQRLRLYNEGTWETSVDGVIRVAEGQAELAASTLLRGAGTVAIGAPGAWPTVAVADLAVPEGLTLAVDGGEVSGRLDVDGTVEWSGGELSGHVRIAPGGRLGLHSAAELRLDGTQVVNEGTIELHEPGTILSLRNGAAVRSTGHLALHAPGRIARGANAPLNVVASSGLITVDTALAGSSGAVQIDRELELHNSGRLEVRSGVLELSGGGRHSLSAGTRLSGPGQVRIDLGSTLHVDGTVDAEAGSDIRVEGGTLAGPGTLRTSGSLTLGAGRLEARVVIAAGGRVDVPATRECVLATAELINHGSFRLHPQAPIWFAGSSLVRNTGELDVDSATRFSTSGASRGVILNSGRIRVAPGVTLDLQGDVSLYNDELVDVGTNGSVKRGGSELFGPGQHRWTPPGLALQEPPPGVPLYGEHDLRIGDEDASGRYGGVQTAANSHVATLQADLAELGFRLAQQDPRGVLGSATEWALRELQACARERVVLQERTTPGGYYLTRVDRVVVPATWPLTDDANGVADAPTRQAIARWKHNALRCPLVLQSWNSWTNLDPAVSDLFGITVPAPTGIAGPAENMWDKDDASSPRPRTFAFDHSDRYVLRHGRVAKSGLPVGDWVTYSASGHTWTGPRSIPPQHTVAEAELLPENLVGRDLWGMTDAETSSFKVVRACSEVECLGYFDGLTAYDNAFISCGPFHWILAEGDGQKVSPGELGGFLAYLRYYDEEAFWDLMGRFGVEPEQSWASAQPGGPPDGSNLYLAAQAKYLTWYMLHRATGRQPLAKREADLDLLRSWPWFFRFQMAGRAEGTARGYRRAMWNMARLRIRDVLSVPWGAAAGGPESVLDVDGRPARVGDVLTSEKAVALLLRWHVRFPAHVVSRSQAGQRLRRVVRAVPARTTVSPKDWGDAEEVALLDALRSEMLAVSNAVNNFGRTVDTVWNFPEWAATGATNPRRYTLPRQIGALSTARRSFLLTRRGLPEGVVRGSWV